jgi:thiol-disulfide isomerase/thioredoxin
MPYPLLSHAAVEALVWSRWCGPCRRTELLAALRTPTAAPHRRSARALRCASAVITGGILMGVQK